MPEVVPLARASSADKVVARLEQVLADARVGRYETVFIVAITPSGKYLTIEAGGRLSRLVAVGIMESIKFDILDVTVLNEEPDDAE